MFIKVNEDVLRRAVTNIELNLGQWDQDTWFDDCNTTACLAGWIVATERGEGLKQVDLGEVDEYESPPEYGRVIFGVPALALDLLGLTDRDEREVFYNHVFMRTRMDDADGDLIDLRREPAALKLFKERITAVTGVEF